MIIKYQKFRIIIRAKEELNLPSYKGSTLRGAFGNTFRRVVCTLKKLDCRECLLKTRCAYAYIFETFLKEPVPVEGMKRYEKIPHPFIIEPPEETRHIYNPEEELTFNLVLVGKAIDYLPYFIYTFEELCKTGIGKGRGTCELMAVKMGDEIVYNNVSKTILTPPMKELPVEVPCHSDNKIQKVTIRFKTPARISYKRDLVVQPEFHILIRSLMRRLLMLHYFHCSADKPSWEHKELINFAEGITIENSSLRWWDWERYSSRQGVRMKMGGIVGDITYSGDLTPFLSILKAGEVLHIGKGTSFGLGRYEIRTSEFPHF